MSLALPWSYLDHWQQLAQTDQDWVCQRKLAHAQPDPCLAGASWSWLYPGLTPAWLCLGFGWPGRVLTLDGLAMLMKHRQLRSS